MKILVADDDPLTLDALEACLSAEGFSVIQARDGREAMAQWERERPDLLCLDIMMPGMDGFELCRRIRAQDSMVPVLFLSAKSEEIDVVVGLELGADDFVRKPFGKHELIARLRAVLRRTQQRSTVKNSFQMNEITIYPLELRAERSGENIDLSPREIALLTVLHEKAGQAVSRDCLLDRCWGLEYYPESRTLDQHIAKLRRRIERDVSEPELIETVRGVGYRFRPKAE